MRLCNPILGCSHKRYTFPMTLANGRPSGERAARKRTYVVCLACGKEFAYDWENMKVLWSTRSATTTRKRETNLADHKVVTA
jgi:hypothetical protein